MEDNIKKDIIQILKLYFWILIITDSLLSAIFELGIEYISYGKLEYTLKANSQILIIIINLLIISSFLKKSGTKIYLFTKNSNYFKNILAFVFLLILYPLNHYWGIFINGLLPSLKFLNNINIMNEVKWSRTWSIFIVDILNPFVQTLLIGIFFQKLREQYNFNKSFLLILVVFIVISPIPQNLISVAGLIYVMCYLWEKNQSILVPYLVYSVSNLVFTVLYFTGAKY